MSGGAFAPCPGVLLGSSGDSGGDGNALSAFASFGGSSTLRRRRRSVCSVRNRGSAAPSCLYRT